MRFPMTEAQKTFIQTFLLVFCTTFLFFGWFLQQVKFEKQVWDQHDACTSYSNFGEDDYEYPNPYRNDQREMEMYFDCMKGEGGDQ